MRPQSRQSGATKKSLVLNGEQFPDHAPPPMKDVDFRAGGLQCC